MYCTKCGNELPDNAKFCPKCGTSTSEQMQLEPQIGKGELENASVQSSTTDSPQVQSNHLNNEQNIQTETVQEESTTAEQFASQPSDDLWANVEKVVQKNAAYYIPQFQKAATGEKTKFNWAAFFFSIYFCFYRKCAHLFKKYFLVPLIITLASTLVLVVGFSQFSLTAMAVGGIVAFAGSIWSFVNGIRFGKNFNREYYAHTKAVLAAGDKKRYGTSMVSALICVAAVCFIYILISGVSSALMFLPLSDSAVAVPDMSTPDVSQSSSADGSISSSFEQDDLSSVLFTSGTFATGGSESSVYMNGGIVAELEVAEDQVTYTVTSISSGERIAMISGASPQGDQLYASGDDGWGNIVAGNIFAIDEDSIAVEFDVVSADASAMWSLSCPYTVLDRCTEQTVSVSSYPIQIRMDNLMSANILGDTFWSAYEGGWIEEWMSLYVNGSSDPDVLYEPFWYDDQLGEWTYYGITYSQAAEAGWGSVWTEIMESNGYA